MEEQSSGLVSAGAAHFSSLLSLAIFPPLTLQALAARCCVLVLAAAGCLAAFRWGPAVFEELHRFIVLFRRACSSNASCVNHCCPWKTLHGPATRPG